MGEIDVCTGEYMAVQERCADAINGGFFHGKRVVFANKFMKWIRYQTQL